MDGSCDGGGVTGFVVGSLPENFAGGFVKSHDASAITAAQVEQQGANFITVSVPGKPDKVVPAVAAEGVPANGFLDRMMTGLQVLVFGAKA